MQAGPPQARSEALEPRPSVELSVVAPAFNEEPNLRALHARVAEALDGRWRWELILVDDGSTDGTAAVIRELSANDPRVRGLVLSRNCGQTTALAVGLRAAQGPLVATLDADLQNDPADLPALLSGLDEHDAVVGWRERRHDTLLRRLSSRVANRLRDWLTGDRVRDTGCSLKVFRAEAIRAVPLFEGMHRFLPTLLRLHGYDVAEQPVSHQARRAGLSKYGILNRAGRGLLDLLVVMWMRRRVIRPPIAETIGAPPAQRLATPARMKPPPERRLSSRRAAPRP
jgi:glycosyltransferase involved in cell wall biosynthesis